MYDFSELKNKLEEVESWLTNEYQGLRTGRATPALIDGIQVESYGSRMPIAQVGSVAIEDARTLRISAWDTSIIKEIEKSISNANLGVGVSSDDKGVRVSFPELTSERRESLIKIAKDKLESARQRVRGVREDIWSAIQAQEKAGDMSEDEKFRSKDELQKHIDASNKTLESFFEKKEAEIHN